MTNTTAREAATALFDHLLSGATPDELAAHFAEDVDWFIPGDTAIVPWLGGPAGRVGVTELYTQLGRATRSQRFEVETILGDGDRCVVLGSLRTEVLATGRVIESDFAFDIAVRDGLIVRYHMFEDSWAVAQALRPTDGSPTH
ncbi:nuclear transport factor 2 family protein [Streptomyces sp. NPDC048290]|uniref:nuclear transport factor 2 family protein n=1 Tax=Streptomyces sp. NPDC048290 TaxID=3155811 RepID=UPI00343F13EB